MSSRYPSTSPWGNRSVSPRSRSEAQFPAERQHQEIGSSDGIFEASEESNADFVDSTELADSANWDERPSSAEVPPELDATDIRDSIDRSDSHPPSHAIMDGSYSASNQYEQSSEVIPPESDNGGFASYFGDNSSSLQQEEDVFNYDYNAQYSAETDQQNISAQIQDQTLMHQDTNAFPIQYDHNYNVNSSVSDYFGDGSQHINESEINRNDYQDYYQQTEQCDQDIAFTARGIQGEETVPEYWNPTDYSQNSQYYDEQSGYYGVPNTSGYHQEMNYDHLNTTDQNFYSNQHEEPADNHQHYFEDVAFADVDLNGPNSGANPQQHPSVRPRSQNPSRPPDPHPVISFAFGGKACFSLIRTTTLSGRPILSQGVEIKPQPGKLRICSTGFLLRETPIEICVSEFPGPVSSSTKISAVCQRQSTSCPTNEVLWKLIDVLASNKGSWDTNRVTALLTSSSTESGNGTWLGSGKIPSASSGSTQPVQATEDDLLHMQALVATGKHVEAAEFASSRALWSHALIISMNCDDRVRLSLIQRFRDSFLLPGSQLYTVYSALAECPIQSTESWKENLAALLNTQKSSVAISQLGELLFSESNIVAAHACFLLSGRLDKLSLLALSGPSFKYFQCPYPESVQLTECFEQSVRQKDSGFTMDALIYARFSYACLLIDLGHCDSALRYVRNVSRSIADSSKNKKRPISEKFTFAVRVVDHHLSQIASSDSGSESAGVLGSIFNNLSKLLIGKEEQDSSKPAPQPAIIQESIQRSSTAPERASAVEPNVKQSDNESTRNTTIMSKITGLFRSRNTSPQGDLADFEEEEKFEWDPVTKKWISNITGPAKPPPPSPDIAPVRRPPPRPHVPISLPPRTSLSRTQITNRYAL